MKKLKEKIWVTSVFPSPFKKGAEPVTHFTQFDYYAHADAVMAKQMMAMGLIVDPKVYPFSGAVDLSSGPRSDHSHHYAFGISPPPKPKAGAFLNLVRIEMDAIRRDLQADCGLGAPWQTALDRFSDAVAEAVEAVGPEHKFEWDERSFAFNWS